MTKFSTRELVTLAVFGTLWGISEISLGSILHAIKLPLTGSIMAGIGLLLAMIARTFVPRRGSTLFVGLIAMILKLFSIGSIVVTPMLAIFMQALIAELVLSLFPAPTRFSNILAGGLGVLWNLLHPFITGPRLFSRALVGVWLDTLDAGSRLLGLPANTVFVIFGVLALLHFIIGGVAGWLAWEVSGLLHVRLRGAEDQAALETKSR